MTQFDKAIWSRNRANPRPLDYRGHKCNYAVCPHDIEKQIAYP